MEEISDFQEFPRAILHVDGDAFFVACEVACRPDLKGKPVVTGEERKIVSALSYEAKTLGISRGMPIHEIKKTFPQVVILPSNYDLYKKFSKRMYAILSRFTSNVEWYSIDECFLDITDLPQSFNQSYERISGEIKQTLQDELGLTFSLGLSVNKVLAKVASKLEKPNGFTIIPSSKIKNFLQKVPLGKVWGIGPSTSRKLAEHGIVTALDFVSRSQNWVEKYCSKPVKEIWHELGGFSILKVHSGERELPKSISRTRTFWPRTSSAEFILSELSRHTEETARSARKNSLISSRFSFFIKTADFRYHRAESILLRPTSLPSEILKIIKENFKNIYDPNLLYRATGVTLSGLIPENFGSRDLFEEFYRFEKFQKVYGPVDSILNKFGKTAVFLCTSLKKSSTGRKIYKKFKREFELPIIGKVD